MAATTKRRPRRQTQPKAPLMPLDQPGRLRIGNLMYLYQRSHQSIYDYIKIGTIPKPDGHDPKPFWLTSTIKPLFERGE